MRNYYKYIYYALAAVTAICLVVGCITFLIGLANYINEDKAFLMIPALYTIVSGVFCGGVTIIVDACLKYLNQNNE